MVINMMELMKGRLSRASDVMALRRTIEYINGVTPKYKLICNLPKCAYEYVDINFNDYNCKFVFNMEGSEYELHREEEEIIVPRLDFPGGWESNAHGSFTTGGYISTQAPSNLWSTSGTLRGLTTLG